MRKSKNDRQIDDIEFRVHDIAKTKAFYGGVFGWRFKGYGPNYCEFQDGRLSGGFTTEGTPQPGGPLVVLYGDDLPALSEMIRNSAGKVSKPIYDFPGGQRLHSLDPNGYELAVWTKKVS
jgi:predicted enzyme related to lactoylglutathione lyase